MSFVSRRAAGYLSDSGFGRLKQNVINYCQNVYLTVMPGISGLLAAKYYNEKGREFRAMGS